MTAYIIRRLWQMIPTMLGVDPARVHPVQLGRRRSRLRAGRQDLATRSRSTTSGASSASTSRTTCSSGSSSSRSLTADFGASWSTNEKVSHILATRLGPSLTVLVPLLILDTLIAIGLALAVAYVRGSLTDRHGDDRLHGRPVDLDPRLHHRLPVRLRLQARLVPGAGLGRQLLARTCSSTRRCRS